MLRRRSCIAHVFLLRSRAFPACIYSIVAVNSSMICDLVHENKVICAPLYGILWQLVSYVNCGSWFLMWIVAVGFLCELWQLASYVNCGSWFLMWIVAVGFLCESWQFVSYVNRGSWFLMWIVAVGFLCELWLLVSWNSGRGFSINEHKFVYMADVQFLLKHTYKHTYIHTRRNVLG